MSTALVALSALRSSLAGRYVIEHELGRGATATVYLARDLRHDRVVALKVLRPELSGVLSGERFVREIAIATRLSHPHILPIYDSGTLESEVGGPVLFYTMPYIAGRSLRERLLAEPQLPVGEAVGIARQVAEALDHAHRQGVVHRDIKPENILLAEGEALVADFGMARAVDVAGGEQLTEGGLALGTPAYMSPEQGAGSARLDGRADIYALGCVLYEMLAGHPPFTGPTAQAILARHAMDPVPSLRTVRSTVGPGLGKVVVRALAKVPADRFPTAHDFVEALAGAGNREAWPPFPRRRRQRLLLGAFAAAALAAALVQVVRRAPGPAPSNPKLVAILPFRIAGANSDLAWLGEGLVDFLAIKITDEGGLRAADPRAVLSAWRQVAGSRGNEITPAAGLEIAKRLGAGRVIDGGVVGTQEHLTITASLLNTAEGRDLAHASVEGPADSLSMLLDRLAARLLSLDAGSDASLLASLTTTSLPAIRAYLAGRAAFRAGRLDEAHRRFREATVCGRPRFVGENRRPFLTPGCEGTSHVGHRTLPGRDRRTLRVKRLRASASSGW